MKITLVHKVLFSVVVAFIAASAVLSFVVASQIKQSFLNEQKRNVAEFVRKQTEQKLDKTDFQTKNPKSLLPKFTVFQEEITTPEIVRIKVYNTQGVVLYSDQNELIGQNLFADEPEELKTILSGKVFGDILVPNKSENIYEKQYGQLLEVYTPISYGTSEVVGIVETYYKLGLLNSEILNSQTNLISFIAIIFTSLFALLFFIVSRASRTLIEQGKQLQEDLRKEQEYSSLKDEFIMTSSHQLRTPASVIKWSLELLTDDGKAKFNEDQTKLLESIRVNNEILIAIVNNLLVIADIKADYFVFEKEGYLLWDLVQNVLAGKEGKIKEKKITVKLAPSQNLKNINFRKDALEKAVNCLIDNALDYTPVGGEINLQIAQKEKSQSFMIKDTGIGIPENEQAKVFDKFFRAKNSIEQKNVGSGLSLYIAKKIIEGFNGKIRFESGESGSAFMFEIPS